MKSRFTLLFEKFHMDSKAVKSSCSNLRGTWHYDRSELKERLTNNVKLSSMDADLKEKVIEEIKH
ncbi:hypothetical protein [Lysinibacillus pakistanensis]|uniref:hypothetical protein n=1 Tax=Lysinibacillus pakistanensis TaxID=759811 RepID=UPI003D2A43DC